MQSNNFIFYKKIDSTQNEIWRLIESKTIKKQNINNGRYSNKWKRNTW